MKGVARRAFMRIKTRPYFACIILFICLLLWSIPACAQGTKPSGKSPVTHFDLGVTLLTLDPGESYAFQITYEPADPAIRTLSWYVTDERVIRVDPLTAEVTALAEGTARIFAQSMDGFSHAVCTVTVGSPASNNEIDAKSAPNVLGLSAKDMKKITAASLRDYLSFLADVPLGVDGLDNVTPRWFDVIAAVKPGKETEQSELARSLGVEQSEPLQDLHTITLAGQFETILAYIKDNPDLIEVYEFGPVWIDDPVPEELDSDSIQKAMGLQGEVEGLTNVSTAHNLGLTGKGRTIAVMDTGADYRHEQFMKNGKSRVLYEACFSGIGSEKGKEYNAACKDGLTGTGSSGAFSAWNHNNFNHGSHVTGIAAGRDGIAPDASIVSVQIFTEVIWDCNSKDLEENACGADHPNKCCSLTSFSSSQARAFQYLIDLSKKGIKIDAVNLSIGGSLGYSGTCDKDFSQKKDLFDSLREEGILPVVAAGNENLDEQLVEPACLSNAYVVGGLMDDASDDPRLRNSSNHHRNVDITAPGTNIYSAYFWPESDKSMGKMSGTSMAAPMVTGAIAIVKQLYPGKSPQDAGRFLQEISTKTVFARWNGKTFPYKKPILTFTDILKGFSIPDDKITASGQTVNVTIDRIMKTSKYTVKVTDLESQQPVKVKTTTGKTKDGKYSLLTINGQGSFEEGRVYRLEITRYLQLKGQTEKIKSQTVQYFSPFSTAITVSAVPYDSRVNLTTFPGTTYKDKSIQYVVKDAETNEVVIRFNVDDSSKLLNASGLVNGRRYVAVAKPFRTVTINRKNVTLWGEESKPVSFVPLSAPLYSKAVWSKNGNVTISCSADRSASGIMVLYRTQGGELKKGCTSISGSFSCLIPKLNTKGSYQFYVMKYKTLKGYTGYSSSVVINRNFPETKLEEPGKIQVYTEQGQTTVYSLYSEKDNGISVLRLNKNKFEPFCEGPGNSCSGNLVGADVQGMYYIMRYSESDGAKTYTPGVFVNNKYSSVQ